MENTPNTDTEMLLPDDVHQVFENQIDQIRIIENEVGRFQRKVDEFDKALAGGNASQCRVAWSRVQRAAVDLRIELSRIQRSRNKGA